MEQNFETLDTFKLSDTSYVRVSKLKNEELCHCVVSFYRELGQKQGDDYSCLLTECHHFVGDLAEYEALNYLMAIDPETAEDASIKSLSDCRTYRPDMDYYFTHAEEEQTEKNREEYIRNREAARSRTAHLRHH